MSAEDNFRDRVLKIVHLIPRAKVLTYGIVASLSGSPRASRIVGGILHQWGLQNSLYPDLPWQRVVNQKGGISTHRIGMGDLQKKLLEEEGVFFDHEEKIPLKKFLWKPSDKMIKQLALPDEILCKLETKFDL